MKALARAGWLAACLAGPALAQEVPAAAASSAAAASTAGAADEAADPLRWSGNWVQGGVLVGHAPAGTRIRFDGHDVRLDAEGAFVIGLDRDEKPDAAVEVQSLGQPSVIRHYTVRPRIYAIQAIHGLPPAQVNPPPAAAARIRRDQAEVRAARARDSDIDAFAGSFQWPATGRISGVFGSQRILNGVPKQPHYGVDVAVPIGTPVKAPADGVVSLAEPDMYFTGGTLMIDHGHGLASAFLHLSKLLVQVGQHVSQGDVIARSGMTGRATGPHLDWRMNWFENHVDAQLLAPPMPGAGAGPAMGGD